MEILRGSSSAQTSSTAVCFRPFRLSQISMTASAIGRSGHSSIVVRGVLGRAAGSFEIWGRSKNRAPSRPQSKSPRTSTPGLSGDVSNTRRTDPSASVYVIEQARVACCAYQMHFALKLEWLVLFWVKVRCERLPLGSVSLPPIVDREARALM